MSTESKTDNLCRDMAELTAELNQWLDLAPENTKKKITIILERIMYDIQQRSEFLKLLQESTSQLVADIHKIAADLEKTRIERDNYKRMLEDRNSFEVN